MWRTRILKGSARESLFSLCELNFCNQVSKNRAREVGFAERLALCALPVLHIREAMGEDSDSDAPWGIVPGSAAGRSRRGRSPASSLFRLCCVQALLVARASVASSACRLSLCPSRFALASRPRPSPSSPTKAKRTVLSTANADSYSYPRCGDLVVS